MAERKVLNKYIPANYNPATAHIRDLGKEVQKKVRLMAPFSMRCNSCGEFVYKGKKFNARKEDAVDEKYLGIQIYRFYIRCPVCAAEITFKTDPKNTDYVAEHGAQRNFEPWRDETRAHQEVRAERIQKEENNAMLALENRTMDSKRELDILDALDEMKTKNAQMERVDIETVLDRVYGTGSVMGAASSSTATRDELERKQDEEDEELAKSLFVAEDGTHVKRVLESERRSQMEQVDASAAAALPVKSSNSFGGANNVIMGVRRKKAGEGGVQKKTVAVAAPMGKKALVAYDSSSEED